VSAVVVAPDGKRAVSGSWDKTLRVWDLETGLPLRTLEGHASGVFGVAVTPDWKRAVSASDDNTLRVWDLETGSALAVFTAESSVRACAVSPDGATIVAGDEGGHVYFLQLVE
jgi:WD40 repeat protein